MVFDTNTMVVRRWYDDGTTTRQKLKAGQKYKNEPGQKFLGIPLGNWTWTEIKICTEHAKMKKKKKKKKTRTKKQKEVVGLFVGW